MTLAWPVTGRDRELHRIGQALAARRSVVLIGAPGVGKSRLMRETMSARRAEQGTVWAALATHSARDLPFGALASLPLDALSSPEVSARAILDELAGLGKRMPIAVAVDDAHHLDRQSAALVLQTAVARVAPVIVTVRSNERAPDAITALWKEGIAERIDVRPMARTVSDRMIEMALSGPVSDSSAARIFSLAEGNALYTKLFVEGALEEELLERIDGLWTLHANALAPSGLLQLVRGRIPLRDPGVLAVAEHLGVCEPLWLSVLTEMTSAEAAEDAERAGVIRIEERDAGAIAIFAHPLFGEVMRHDSPRTVQRRLRARISEALAPYGEGEIVRRGMLQLGSDMARDPVLLCAAARKAKDAFDLRLALRLAHAAVDAGAGHEGVGVRAAALTFLGRGVEAEHDLQWLTARVDDEPTRAAVLILRAGNLAFPCGEPERAIALLNDELPRAGQSRATIWAMRRMIESFVAGHRLDIAELHSVLTSGTGTAVGDFVASYAWLAIQAPRGAITPGDPIVDRGYALSEPSDLANTRFGYTDVHMLGLRIAGYGQVVSEVATARETEFEGVPEPIDAQVLHIKGMAAFYRGHLCEANRLLEQARVRLRAIGSVGQLSRCLQILTQVLGLLGDHRASVLLQEMHDEAHPALGWAVPEALLAEAWVRASTGDISGAVREAFRAADVAHEQGSVGHEALALHVAVRMGSRDAAARLREVAGSLDCPAGARWGAYARGILLGDASAIAEVSVAEEREGDLVAAADFAAHAAQLWREQGSAGRGAMQAERAVRLATAAGNPRTPLLTGLNVDTPLSAREREVVVMLAHNLSNREIATQLGVSVRTAEGHVYRLMTKLGVSHRDDIRGITDASP